jgi:hypothetical protein
MYRSALILAVVGVVGVLVAPTPRAPYLQAGAEAHAGEFVQHCVQAPDDKCGNKKFYCEVTHENLENPPTDTHDGHGNRICCWSHYHP